MFQTPQGSPVPEGPPRDARLNMQTQPIPQRQPIMNIAGSPARSQVFQPQMQTQMYMSNQNAPYMPQQGVVVQTGMPMIQGYPRAQLQQYQMPTSQAQYQPVVSQPALAVYNPMDSMSTMQSTRTEAEAMNSQTEGQEAEKTAISVIEHKTERHINDVIGAESMPPAGTSFSGFTQQESQSRDGRIYLGTARTTNTGFLMHSRMSASSTGQLSSVSLEGRRQYDRMFLLSLRYVTASMIKPAGLPVSDVILKKPLNPSDQLLDSLPNLYPAGYVKPFKMSKDNVLSFLSPAKSNTYSEVFHKMIVEQNKDNDEIFDWIFNNVSSSVQVNRDFVRSLMQSVCISALKELMDDIVTWELMEDKLVRRVKVLRKFLTKADLELQALYALQAIMQRLGHPQGLLQQFFDVLYDEVVISEDCFYAWEKDNNPQEAGKKQARKSVVPFFTWLRGEQKQAINAKHSKKASNDEVWVSQQQALLGTRPKTFLQTGPGPGPGPLFSVGSSNSINASRNSRRRKNQRKRKQLSKMANVNNTAT